MSVGKRTLKIVFSLGEKNEKSFSDFFADPDDFDGQLWLRRRFGLLDSERFPRSDGIELCRSNADQRADHGFPDGLFIRLQSLRGCDERLQPLLHLKLQSLRSVRNEQFRLSDGRIPPRSGRELIADYAELVYKKRQPDQNGDCRFLSFRNLFSHRNSRETIP